MLLIGGKSLSKLGKELDQQKYYNKEQKLSITRKNLEKRIHRQFIKINQNKRQDNPTFNTVSRQIKSSFTMRNTKDSTQNRYKPLFTCIQPHIFECNISKTLTKHPFDVNIRPYSSSTLCPRYSLTTQFETISRSQKSLHHLDFDKQSPRKFHNIPKQSVLDPQSRFNNFKQSTTSNKKIRPFSSYTQRKELFHKPVHPLMINLRQFKTHLLRKGQSASKHVPFDKISGKIHLRSDKDVYERPSQFNQSRSNFLSSRKFSDKSTFMSQSDRKPNMVKSQYHFRMCL